MYIKMIGKCTTHPVITCNDQIVRKHVSENKNKIKVIMMNTTIYFMLIDGLLKYSSELYPANLQEVCQNFVAHFNVNFNTQA